MPKKKKMPNRRIKVKGFTLEVVSPKCPFSDATTEERAKDQAEMIANGGIHPAWFSVTAEDVQRELDKDKLN
jgi:hypothetical protein